MVKIVVSVFVRFTLYKGNQNLNTSITITKTQMNLSDITPAELPVENMSIEEPTQKPHRGKGQGKGKRSSNPKIHSTEDQDRPKKDKKIRKERPELTKEEIISKKVKVLTKIYGPHKDIEEFAIKTQDQRMGFCIKSFALVHNIERKPAVHRPEKMKRRLSLFLNKPASDFDKVVDSNPNLKFRQILNVLKEEGTIKFELEDLQQFKLQRKEFRNKRREERQNLTEEQRKEFREARQQQRLKRREERFASFTQEEREAIKEARRCEKKQRQASMSEQDRKALQEARKMKKSQKKDEKDQKEVKEIVKKIENVSIDAKPTKAEEMREKGRILIQMKKLYGVDKAQEIFKFIEENFSLGAPEIIKKWEQSH